MENLCENKRECFRAKMKKYWERQSFIPHYFLGTVILRVDSDIVFVSTQKWAPKEQRDSDSVESLCENFVRTSESVLEPQ